MLIDTHTHVFPETIAARAITALEEGMWNTNACRNKAVIGGTLPDLLAEMDRSGVDLSVVAPIATKVTQSTSINHFAEQITDGKRILSFGSVHPLQPDYEAVLEDLAARGFLGIKLHPEFQDFFIDSPHAIRVLQKAESLGLIILLHAGADMGYKPPYRCIPQRLAAALDHLDGRKIIAAHMGGYLMWEDVAKYLLDSPIYLDTAAVCREISTDTAMALILDHGPENILFASDSPWYSQGETRRWLEFLPLTDAQRELIAWKNFARLAQLPL